MFGSGEAAQKLVASNFGASGKRAPDGAKMCNFFKTGLKSLIQVAVYSSGSHGHMGKIQ